MRCGGGRGTRARPLRFVATWWPAAAGKETVGGPRRSCGVLLRGAPPGRHPPRAPRGSQVPRRRATLSGGYAQPPLCRRGPGGPQRVPCSATPCGARHGAPLRNPGARPPRATEPHARRSGPHGPRAAPRSPRWRFCSTYHGNTVPGLPPGSGSPRGPAALTAPSSVTFARCKQSQATPGRATRSTPAGTLEAEVQFGGRGFCLPAQVCAPPTGAGAVGPQAQAGCSGT